MSNQAAFQLSIPATMPKSVGYSQLAIVESGKLAFIAGQVALDTSGKIVGENDVRAQLQQVFENLKAALTSAGGTFRDIVKLNIYYTDRSHLAAFREIRDEYINLSNPPASTAVQVAGLFRPEFLIEIEAVAVLSE